MEVIEEGVIEEGQDARPLGNALWVGHDHVNESWHAVTQVSVVSTVNVPHHLYLSQENTAMCNTCGCTARPFVKQQGCCKMELPSRQKRSLISFLKF